MAKREHDDLADALARLAAGEVAPSETEPPDPADAVHRLPPPVVPNRQTAPQFRASAPVKPAQVPVQPKPTPGVQTPKPVARPVAPRAREEQAIAKPAAAVGPVRPGVPATPVRSDSADSPRQRPSVPMRPSTPSVPNLTAPEDVTPEPPMDSSGIDDSLIIDDDDEVIVPAPDPSVFAAKPKVPVVKPVRVPTYKTLGFRRTAIPIMLTCGTLFLIMALLPFVLPAESPFVLDMTSSIIVLVAACAVLTLAVLNMLAVKQELAVQR